jgi:hypothetical protein
MTTGAIGCNQEAYIDRFLRKYGLDVAHESWYGSRSFAFAGETKQALRAGIFYEQIELQAKLLNYFLGSNKSNINQMSRADKN